MNININIIKNINVPINMIICKYNLQLMKGKNVTS